MSTLRNLLLLCTATAISQVVTGPTAVPNNGLGAVATTTVAGQTNLGVRYEVGASIYGPFEDGFGAADSALLTSLGCSPASKGYVPPGIDTFTAEQMIEAQCSVSLPKPDGTNVLDACGGIEGHLHDNLSCLYSEDPTGHSAKVGEANDAARTPVYGRWEDKAGMAIPALDACNGHFGPTPEDPTGNRYHHHVAGLAPFVIGCYGPAADANNPTKGKLVSPTECRKLYPNECGNGDYIEITTPSGSRQYDPYCPCFEGLSNVGDMPPATPPTPSPLPSPLPLPPPTPPVGGWQKDHTDATLSPSGCINKDFDGDFDHNGRPTLGDAVFIANARLEYGSTEINPIKCLFGDFDSDGTFTLNDAAHVAEAQFNKAFLPWDVHASYAIYLAALPTSGRRALASTDSKAPVDVVMEMQKASNALEVQVHVARADSAAAAWKALSVQFKGGKIASVHMPFGKPGQITSQFVGGFFQAADLGGAGTSFPTGHVATVTFEAGTDMAGVSIDYSSMNSYVVVQADAACKPAKGTPCATMLPKVVSPEIVKAAPKEAEPVPAAKVAPIKKSDTVEAMPTPPMGDKEPVSRAEVMTKWAHDHFIIFGSMLLGFLLILIAVSLILRRRSASVVRTEPIEVVKIQRQLSAVA